MSEKTTSDMSPTHPKLSLGFLHHYGLGDNLTTLKSLYLAKKAYNYRLTIFGNANFKQILSYCGFLDSADLVVDISHLCEESLPIVASHKCDYFILTNPKSHYIRLLSSLDTPIITPLKFPSFFSLKAKCPPLHFFPIYYKLRADNALCALIRLIDKKAFDSFVLDSIHTSSKIRTKSLAGGGRHYKQKSSYISSLDFACKMEQLDTVIKNELKLKVPNDKIAQSFLSKCVESYAKGLETSIDSKCGTACKPPQPFIICINPFSNAATHTLPLEMFLELISRVLTLPNCCVLVITFPSVHSEFVAQVRSHHKLSSAKSKLFIYQNDNSLQNLIALLGFQSLLVSPSTGTIHLASNLGIKTIGLYSRKDTTRWATQDNLYTIIPKEKSLLTQKHCDKIIDQTIRQIQSLIDSNALKPFEIADSSKSAN